MDSVDSGTEHGPVVQYDRRTDNVQICSFSPTVVSRPWRNLFWAIATYDIVYVILIFVWRGWDYSNDVTKMELVGNEEYGRITIPTTIIFMSYLLQFVMGVMFAIALRMRNDARLLDFLHAYLICSFILLATICFVIIHTILIVRKSKIFGYERLLRIFSCMINLIFKVLATLAIMECLTKN